MQSIDKNNLDFVTALDARVIAYQEAATRLNGGGIVQGIHQPHVLSAGELGGQVECLGSMGMHGRYGITIVSATAEW